ncbi:MAG: hypothetical protein Q8N88_07355 [Nanoarchaeota archaeon]|nr:hypothetical protein [Nanoarchaeota archaeon]
MGISKKDRKEIGRISNEIGRIIEEIQPLKDTHGFFQHMSGSCLSVAEVSLECAKYERTRTLINQARTYIEYLGKYIRALEKLPEIRKRDLTSPIPNGIRDAGNPKKYIDNLCQMAGID